MTATASSTFTLPSAAPQPTPASTPPSQSPKMLFIATHPRSTSTALERAFLTRTGNDTVCVHEPFGDAFYYGPERMSTRFSDSECKDSPYSQTTYQNVVQDIKMAIAKAQDLVKNKYEQEQADSDDSSSSSSNNDLEPVVVIKDMAQYIIPPPEEHWFKAEGENLRNNSGEDGRVTTASSFSDDEDEESLTTANKANPTVVPSSILEPMRFVFLLRSPHLAVPSYYRCCIPPLSERTGFDSFRSSEVGYRELRILFDHLQSTGTDLLVIDSEDLCSTPGPVIEQVCLHSGIPFSPSMLEWEQNSQAEVEMFAKWKGFHDDALNSKGFGKNRGTPTTKQLQSKFTIDYETWEKNWAEKYTPEQVKEIKDAVKEHMDDYLYLRQFKTNF